MPFDNQLQEHLRKQAPATAEHRCAPEHEGRIITYSPEKRYGWIAQAGDGADLFIHASELRKAGIANLCRGDRIQFDIKPDRRTGRPAAVNVQAIAVT